MKHKLLLISLLIFGLILVGSGLWLRYHSQPPAHEGTPVVVMDTWTSGIATGRDYLRIYQDGYVIFIREGRGVAAASRFMTWSISQLTNVEIAELSFSV